VELGKSVVSRVQMTNPFLLRCVRSKEQAGTRTAKLRQEKEVQDRQLQADVEALKNLEENLRQLTDRDQQLAAQVRFRYA
jgi:structural maintenance of chromosome 1